MLRVSVPSGDVRAFHLRAEAVTPAEHVIVPAEFDMVQPVDPLPPAKSISPEISLMTMLFSYVSAPVLPCKTKEPYGLLIVLVAPFPTVNTPETVAVPATSSSALGADVPIPTVPPLGTSSKSL